MKHGPLKDWQRRHGLNQIRAARALGLSERHYRDLVKGRAPIADQTARLVAAIDTLYRIAETTAGDRSSEAGSLAVVQLAQLGIPTPDQKTAAGEAASQDLTQ